MQTFVPLGPQFQKNAMVLDRQRLGKQRVEAWQILNTLTGQSKGWQNHPAVSMWRGYEPALALYGAHMSQEWMRRGYKDTMLERFIPHIDEAKGAMPPWLYNNDLVVSHRSNLIRKLPEHYSQYWPDVPNDLPYVWPVGKE